MVTYNIFREIIKTAKRSTSNKCDNRFWKYCLFLVNKNHANIMICSTFYCVTLSLTNIIKALNLSLFLFFLCRIHILICLLSACTYYKDYLFLYLTNVYGKRETLMTLTETVILTHLKDLRHFSASMKRLKQSHYYINY